MGQKPLAIGEPRSASIGHHYQFKILLIGDESESVGKTSLLSRYVDDVYPGVPDRILVVKTVPIRSILCKLQFWDQKDQSSQLRGMRGSSGVIIVYDVTNQTSFNNVKHWLQDIDRCAYKEVDTLLVGNKSDLKKSSSSVVDHLVAKEFADNLGIHFIETSALESKDVKEAFEILVNAIIERILHQQTENVRQTRPADNKESQCLLH